jgi:hypothetical protein
MSLSVFFLDDGFIPDLLTLGTDAKFCIQTKHCKRWDDFIPSLFIPHHPSNQMYPRWIHRGEPLLDGWINECANNTCFDDNGCTNEVEEHDPGDRIPDMVHELLIAEDGGQKSMFATILEEMKQQLYPGSASTRFSYIMKLLHIKSFYKISNDAFNAILKLLSLTFLNCSLPVSYAATKKLLSALGLGYDSIHVCRITVFCFRKSMLNLMNACVWFIKMERWGTNKASTSKSIASFSIDSKVADCF